MVAGHNLAFYQEGAIITVIVIMLLLLMGTAIIVPTLMTIAFLMLTWRHTKAFMERYVARASRDDALRQVGFLTVPLVQVIREAFGWAV